MSFLDNLENNLKALESRDERGSRDERKHREAARERARAAAPWAEKLRTGAFTAKLMEQAAVIGHEQRTKIYITWLENTLRLEARGRKLDLKPTSDGVVAVYADQDGRTEPVDLGGDPEKLLRAWLAAG